MARTVVSQSTARDVHIPQRLPFRAASLTGETHPNGAYVFENTGRMRPETRERFRADAPRIRYIVRSYATPIAWVLDDGTAVVPDDRYSVTTGRQQALVRAALRVSVTR